MNNLEQEFQSILDQRKPSNLYEPISYILLQSGKRLRPQLVHLAVDLYDGDPEEAQKVAMAFEMLHNFTLIHDDIMDEAPIRRGKETVYKKWNSNIAILSGDALAIMAFQQLLRLQCEQSIILKIAEVFSATSLQICEGQQYDLDFEKQSSVSIAEYMEMIRLKTAVMFAGCLKSGALLMSADEESQQALYNFGIELGLAFQLVDDCLDLYADEATFGKRVGGDIRDNKKSYLYLKALELANPEQRADLEHWYATPTTDFEQKIAAVKHIFDDLHVNQHTEEEVLRHVQKAMRELNTVRVAEEKKGPLRDLATRLIDRDK